MNYFLVPSFSQVGYSTSSPMFSDDVRFPLYSRTIPSETLNNMAIVKLIQKFRWRRVAILAQQDHFFIEVIYSNSHKYPGIPNWRGVQHFVSS